MRRAIAIYAITKHGLTAAARLARSFPNADLMISTRLRVQAEKLDFGQAKAFDLQTPFSEQLGEVFHAYECHLFIVSTGAVVRLIAPLLKGDADDPAVVTTDDANRFVLTVLNGRLGQGVEIAKEAAMALCSHPILWHHERPAPRREVVVGLGCDRGASAAMVEKGVLDTLHKHALAPQDVTALATIDLKAKEAAFLALAAKYQWPLYTYPASLLDKVEGIENPSEMVKRYTGSRSVAEAAALHTADAKKLLVAKTCYGEPDGQKYMTVAIAQLSL